MHGTEERIHVTGEFYIKKKLTPILWNLFKEIEDRGLIPYFLYEARMV